MALFEEDGEMGSSIILLVVVCGLSRKEILVEGKEDLRGGMVSGR